VCPLATRDSSRSYVTGAFDEKNAANSIEGLTPLQVADIWHWIDFYGKHAEYFYVGKLIGLYYDEKGEPTENFHKLKAVLVEADKIKAEEEAEKTKFPGCNSSWNEKDGGEVWCSDLSGGIKRNWAGVPRKLFQRGKTDYRCICASPKTISDPHLKEYESCPPDSYRCKIV